VNIGDRFTEHFIVSADIHKGFIALFGDRHPLHTDAGYAVARGFQSEVMHGNILNGFLSYFIGECLPEREVMILAQEIKYQRPVYLEDRLILEAEIVAEHHSVNVIELACKFRKEIDGKIVASAKVHVNRVRLQGGVKSLTS
jgi:3-hydroxybutyryl-CoA dehydratase